MFPQATTKSPHPSTVSFRKLSITSKFPFQYPSDSCREDRLGATWNELLHSGTLLYRNYVFPLTESNNGKALQCRRFGCSLE